MTDKGGLSLEQVLEIDLPGFRRVLAPANPYDIDDALVGDPVGDAIIWIIASEDEDNVYPWYTAMPLFHPDDGGLGIEVGTQITNLGILEIIRPPRWPRSDPAARARLTRVLTLETPIVREKFGTAAGWAKHAINDEHDYDEFPDLVETKAYAYLLSGDVPNALALLERLAADVDTVGRRSATMRDLINRDHDAALQLLDTWRQRRLAMFGLTAPDRRHPKGRRRSRRRAFC